ncbi:sulfite exporter TauE/SafE family protein [Vibrio ponticus]|uniref:Probable membrane transporter protein n=1 Tax=Vibrio ponticus TaxID=265668 RepID=A0A3N3DRI8_9VIBR|nr:sulfite exporter TauE/SafE family protein [Vibrio ponticus]ROV57092.1 sulfite exporter TauE/SafE family protein [Vibrio ponticus]
MELSVLFTEFFTTEALGLKVLAGVIYSLCVGLTGVGGGVLLIPLLQVLFDMHTVLAVGTASVISALVKISASFGHIKARNLSLPATGYLLIGAVPLVVLTTQLVVYFHQQPHLQLKLENFVEGLIVMVMVAALFSVLIKMVKQSRKQVVHHAFSGKKAVGAGMLCGASLGITGVGGGVLLLPLLNSLLNIEIKKAVGTSVVLSLLLSGITALGYAQGGQIDMGAAALFTFASLLGAPLASRLLAKMSDLSVYRLTLTIITVSLSLTLLN